jgi:hypothetical protein
MSLASNSRKHVQDWFKIAERLPLQERQQALNVAEAWFRLAMDANFVEPHPDRSCAVVPVSSPKGRHPKTRAARPMFAELTGS